MKSDNPSNLHKIHDLPTSDQYEAILVRETLFDVSKRQSQIGQIPTRPSI